jgi:hypothetical protein
MGVGPTLLPLGRATLSAVKGVGAGARTVRRAYYVRKLGYYQQQGAVENVAACCHTPAGYYSSIGDYNGAISYLLQAAKLAKEFSRSFYYNELGNVATEYLEWGSYSRACPLVA